MFTQTKQRATPSESSLSISHIPLKISALLISSSYMAEKSRNRKDTTAATSRTAAQLSRLQRRRPTALQIAPASWNAAIPLLSPLESSPTAVERKLEMKSQSREEVQQQQQRSQMAETGKAVVFKKWQHPAAPFCYDSAQFVPSFFVPV